MKAKKSAFQIYKLNVLSQHGHVVPRLLAYLSELNRIAKIWARVERLVTFHNVLQQNIGSAFKSIMTENWTKVCQHVGKINLDYLEKKSLLEWALERFQFTVNPGSSDEKKKTKVIRVHLPLVRRLLCEFGSVTSLDTYYMKAFIYFHIYYLISLCFF